MNEAECMLSMATCHANTSMLHAAHLVTTQCSNGVASVREEGDIAPPPPSKQNLGENGERRSEPTKVDTGLHRFS